MDRARRDAPPEDHLLRRLIPSGGRPSPQVDGTSFFFLLRQVASNQKQVKASGGIRSLYDVKTMLDAGADIIGTSAGVNIAKELVASREE